MFQIVVLLLTWLCSGQTIFAEQPERLSLREALQIAYQQNPRMAAVRQEAEAARGRWVQARALPNPEVEISADELSQGVRAGSTVGEDSISLAQKADLLGTWFRGRSAKAEYRSVQHLVLRAWNEVAFEVTKTYNDLLLATQQVGVAREVLELTRRLLDQVQLRYNAGEALRNELLQAQIEAAKAETAVLEAEKQITLQAGALNVLLGREARTPVTPSDDLTYEPRDVDAEQLLSQALARRPDLKANDELVKARKERLRLAFSEIIEAPTVSAMGTRERGEAGTERVFGLAISWPLPFWNQNQGAIREAKAELAKQQVERDALARQVGLEVQRALAEAQLAQRQVSVWRTAIEQANELMRLATQQYREGDINFITYLEHLATIRETKVTYVETLANYRTQLALVDQAVANTLTPGGKEEVR